MHEMSIALRIIEIATLALPPDAEDIAVEKVNLRVGKLTAIIPKSLEFCFNIASRDTPLAGAALDIEEIEIVIECNDCGKQTVIDSPPFACRHCGAVDVDIISGRELLVTSLEIADEPGE